MLPVVNQLGLKDGLSNSEVRCIFQDRQGYMWFGTYDGLNRFDGYDFKIYRNRVGDKGSIIHSYINAVVEDSFENMWVGTRQGISVLDPVSDRFSTVNFVQKGSAPHQLDAYISGIKIDGKGKIFVATLGSGMIVFSGSKNKTGFEVPLLAPGASRWIYDVQAIYITSANKIYLLVGGVGLCIYDSSSHGIRLIDAAVKNGTCLSGEHDDLWLGANTGLYLYSFKRGSYIRLIKQSVDGLSSNRVTSVVPMPNNELWIGTDGGGLNILNQKSGKFNYLSFGYDQHSLTSNAVYSVFIDKESRKWIGTLRGGINIIDNLKARFQNITHNPADSNSLGNNFVKSLFEDLNGILWIGTDGGGLSSWNRNTNRFENYHSGKRPGMLSSNFITDIKKDYQHKLWVATYGGGIDLYIPETKKFKAYMGYNANGRPLYSIFWALREDSQKNLWASGLQDGLFLFNRKLDQFRIFDSNIKNVLSLYEDRHEQLWAGTFEGLYQIDIKSRKYTYHLIGKPVRTVFEDVSGRLWLGTEAGLMLYDTKSHHVVSQYTTADGLSNNNILSIEGDSLGNLWMSTYNGLAKFDIRIKKFTNFFPSDGLQNREFSFNASAALASGELAFGGVDGLSIFFPEQILPIKNSPNIVINQIKINNTPINAKPDYITSIINDHIASLSVPFEEAALSIGFSAIEFTSQERINYRYKLIGWDRGWNNIGHNRSATYTRLSPGSYIFQVNCSNAEGQWTKNITLLKVVVLPPWYRTWQAYLVYLGIICVCLYWFLSYRIRETRLKYEIKLAKLDADNQKSLQDKERELNEKRMEFFTGVAHEFRTPLSLIINPVNDLLKNSGQENQRELNIVFRNARRLLSLVDQLLLFRKADSGISLLNVSPLNIVKVCEDVFVCFVQQAKYSNIRFEMIASVPEICIVGDREKIEIILFNLISNALKYTPAGKQVVVSIEETPNEVEIKIIDSGYGISSEIGDRLFDKFYRARESHQQVKAGFGIGLYLVKQFTLDHKGSISYQSYPDAGTTFILKLKKGIAHYPPEIVSDIETTSSELLTELTKDSFDLKPDSGRLISATEFKAGNVFTEQKAILIIDDDDEIRNYIKSVLEDKYIIYEAEDGECGLSKAKEKLPDLIVCDVMMPGMNGIELCQTIKRDAQLSYIPMILLTASSTAEGKLKGLESGADDYISKPFEKDILVARIANLLQIRSNLQSYFYNSVTLKTSNITISEEYKIFLQKCIEIVERHITDPDFNVKVLSEEIGMSHSNLYRKVKSLSGHTINSFIRFIRLRKAAELLIQSEMNVNEVAMETGFISIKYFRTQFYKLFGTNPSDFARQNRPVFKKRFNVID